MSSYSHSAYHDLTHGEGFFRYFFNILKAATTGPDASLGKLFITGVSPITLDDVTSGFNICTNISLVPQFNEVAGFTEDEVLKIWRHYYEHEVIDIDERSYLDIVQKWYNNYKFSPDATQYLYNPDMIFYFISQYRFYQHIP